MYARVARFEGGTAEALRASADEVNANADQGPPPGVPSTGFTMLIDPEGGRSIGIALFETEEDMRKGDEVLNGMNPSGADVGRRTSVEMYEVGADLRL